MALKNRVALTCTCCNDTRKNPILLQQVLHRDYNFLITTSNVFQSSDVEPLLNNGNLSYIQQIYSSMTINLVFIFMDARCSNDRVPLLKIENVFYKAQNHSLVMILLCCVYICQFNIIVLMRCGVHTLNI